MTQEHEASGSPSKKNDLNKFPIGQEILHRDWSMASSFPVVSLWLSSTILTGKYFILEA